MLTDSEKAYCQALAALKQKEYERAGEKFNQAAGDFGTNTEFGLLYQTTELLLAVRSELAAYRTKDRPEVKELLKDG